MNRLQSILFDKRFIAFIGFLALAGALLLLASMFELPLIWVWALLLICCACWLLAWAWRRHRASRGANIISGMIEAEADRAVQSASADKRPEVEALRNRMLEAVKTIKTSKLGETTGKTALYELPWYLVIGNPAAGKSSAIVNSGLHFPFSDVTGSVIH